MRRPLWSHLGSGGARLVVSCDRGCGSDRLEGWIEKVKDVGTSLQEEIPELATMA